MFEHRLCIMNNSSLPQDSFFADSVGEEFLFSDKESYNTGIVANPAKEGFLADLLPYDTAQRTGAGLRNGLQEYQMLISASLEAFRAFADRDFEKFNPLVGENACQVQAIWGIVISVYNLVCDGYVINRLNKSLFAIKNLLLQRSIDKLMNSGISLMELLEREGLNIKLTFINLMVVKFFLLNESKTNVDNEGWMSSLFLKEIKCDAKKLQRFGNISIQFAKNLAKELRRSTAEASVQFVREIAKKMNDPLMCTMLSERFTVKHIGYLLCTPMFWTYKSVLHLAQTEKIPLILHTKFLEKEPDGYRVIDSDWLYFKNLFKRTNPISVDDKAQDIPVDEAAIIIQGVACVPSTKNTNSKYQWRERMRARPIADVILAGAADHRQYPDVERDGLIRALQDAEYGAYKSLARSAGFAWENPSTFFIQHVYASTFQRFLSNANKTVVRQAVAVSNSDV